MINTCHGSVLHSPHTSRIVRVARGAGAARGLHIHVVDLCLIYILTWTLFHHPLPLVLCASLCALSYYCISFTSLYPLYHILIIQTPFFSCILPPLHSGVNEDFGVRYFTVTWASGGPQEMSSGCSPHESEVMVEVPSLLLQCMQCRTRGWGWLPGAQLGVESKTV